MMLSRCILALLLVTGVFGSSSCRPGGETEAVEEDASSSPEASAPSANGGPGVDTASEDEADELPPVIYYDLTRFEWYARGEPMRLDDGSYAPRGTPVRAATSEMEKIGEYEGVEYYARDNGSDSEGIVYVPVFEGFWLPFVRE